MRNADLVLSMGNQLTDMNLGATRPQVKRERSVWALHGRVNVSFHQYTEVTLRDFVGALWWLVDPGNWFDALAAMVAEMRDSAGLALAAILVTAAAFLHFAEAGAELAVLEIGLGGRLDASNVVKRPLGSVIASIGFDHMEHLGSTLGAIAREKAGVLRPGALAVCGPLPPEARAAVDNVNAAIDAYHELVDPDRSLHPRFMVGEDGAVAAAGEALADALKTLDERITSREDEVLAEEEALLAELPVMGPGLTAPRDDLLAVVGVNG